MKKIIRFCQLRIRWAFETFVTYFIRPKKIRGALQKQMAMVPNKSTTKILFTQFHQLPRSSVGS